MASKDTKEVSKVKKSTRLNGSSTQAFGTPKRISHDSSTFYARKMYENQRKEKEVSFLSENPLPKEVENRIFYKSAEQMSELPDSCVHLIVTSPPYNAAKSYDKDLSLEEYLCLLKRVFTECYRVLVEGGRACVNVANLGRKPYVPLSAWVTKLMIDIGFHMRGEIIWQKGAGAGVSMAWGSWCSASNPVLRDTHEYILTFSKGNYKRPLSTDKVSTISKEEFMEWTQVSLGLLASFCQKGRSSCAISSRASQKNYTIIHLRRRRRPRSIHRLRHNCPCCQATKT